MRIDGEWFACDDGIVRPIVRSAVLGFAGAWEPVIFLVDTGADRTVFSGAVVSALGFPTTGASERLGGVGGTTEFFVVSTQIRMRQVGGRDIVLRGRYAALTAAEAFDISVLGRDVLDLFTVIVDRPQSVVTLLSQRHRYRIEAT
jgi:hypothetical protein